MMLMDQVQNSLQSVQSGPLVGLEQAAITDIRALVCKEAWIWYHDNLHMTLITIAKLFGLFSISLHVSDLHPLFVALFGPDPSA